MRHIKLKSAQFLYTLIGPKTHRFPLQPFRSRQVLNVFDALIPIAGIEPSFELVEIIKKELALVRSQLDELRQFLNVEFFMRAKLAEIKTKPDCLSTRLFCNLHP